MPVNSRALQMESPVSHRAGSRERLSLPALSLLIFCVSFLAHAWLTRGVLDGMGIPLADETIQVARTLALQGRFADPFAMMPTGPTAHVAPVYTAFLAAVFRFLGFGLGALTVVWMTNLVFIGVQMALLPALFTRFGLGVLPGIVAAGLGTFVAPFVIDYEWESLLLGMELVLLCLLTADLIRGKSTRARIAALGVLWGVTLLTSPVAAVLLAAWLFVALGCAPRASRRTALRASALVVGIAAIVCAPWIVRNKMRLGGYFLIRDNLGLELSVSNNDCAQATLAANVASGCHKAMHPHRNLAAAQEVARLGEYEFNREKMAAALAWIAQNPRRFASLTAQRIVLFWFPQNGAGPIHRRLWAVWGVTLISFFGLWRLWRRNRVAAWLMGSALLAYPLIYYFAQFEPRYRDPIFWVSLFLAAFALADVLPWPASWRAAPQQAGG